MSGQAISWRRVTIPIVSILVKIIPVIYSFEHLAAGLGAGYALRTMPGVC
jgi:hypothetical protein